jgi:hypothetical protein
VGCVPKTEDGENGGAERARGRVLAVEEALLEAITLYGRRSTLRGLVVQVDERNETSSLTGALHEENASQSEWSSCAPKRPKRHVPLLRIMHYKSTKRVGAVTVGGTKRPSWWRMSEAPCVVKKKDANWVGDEVLSSGIQHPTFVPV